MFPFSGNQSATGNGVPNLSTCCENGVSSHLKLSHQGRKTARLSKFDHVPMHERGHSRVMASESAMLTHEEFASLLTVGNTSAVRDPPPVIPAEHSTRLIELGYI